MLFRWCLLFIPFSLSAEMGYVEPWGKDAVLNERGQVAAERRLSTAGKVGEKIISFYQSSITQISGPRSHFRPTSSQYMLEAIRENGFFKGYIMGCDRLLRENSDPWVYRTRVINEKLYKWDSPSS